MNKTVHPEFFKGSHFKSHPIQIPIKPYCNLAVASCLVTFLLPPLAYTPIHRYIDCALSKISKLALVGYEYTAHTVRFMGFFCMRNFSMRSHVMAKLWRDAFERASCLYYWSTNPSQLCHLNYLVVIGKAPKSNTGAHSHA